MLRVNPATPKMGFTLIELLTVIAIISILAAILLPTLKSIRESANQAKCVANLRMMGQAIALYCAENKGDYPLAINNSWSAFTPVDPARYPNYGVLTTLLDYSKDKFSSNTFKQWDADHYCNCPSSNNLSSYRDYALNVEVMGFNGGNNIDLGNKTINIIDPAKIILAGDNAGDQPPYKSRTYFDLNKWPYAQNLGERHQGKCNLLFADYHIESQKPSDIKAEQINPFL